MSELTLVVWLHCMENRGLAFNQLNSSIPSTIGQLTALRQLYVFVLSVQCRRNTPHASAGILPLTSTIPSTFGQLTALTRLYVVVLTLHCRWLTPYRFLENNNLFGPIPSSIGQLSSLTFWYEAMNSRTGINSISRFDPSELQSEDTERNCLVSYTIALTR
jgi:hypothetical protein